MSFFGKFKTGSATNGTTVISAKRDPNAPIPTALDKHLADLTGPPRIDGSDKFFGFENYGSTCYCNSIIQCLYYSAPFRESVIRFPSASFLDSIKNQPSITRTEDEEHLSNGALSPQRTAASSLPTSPYPNPTSPARKPTVTSTTVAGSPSKAEDNKDSPEYKKKMAIQTGPVLDMTQDKSGDYGMDESLFTSLKDIFAAVIANKSRTGVVSPHKFLEILRRENEMFRSAMHQDAHEFLNLLLNSVVENVEEFSKQYPSGNGTMTNGHVETTLDTMKTKIISFDLDPRWVHNLFEGTLTSETRCLTCETTSQRDEAFLDLSVDLAPHTSVTSCLRKFSQEEMLCERNKFHCDNCGGLQEAEKRMKIKRLPRILALHLKRFKYTEDLQRLQKLFHRVVYPFYLRLFNTTDDAEDSDRLYELYAVVVHIGGGPYHGHYVSIVKTQDRGWLLFDDELVEPVNKEYVLNFFGGEPVQGSQDARQLACAYVLFYQETTLEAMLREEEAEGQKSAPAANDADIEQTKLKAETTALLGLTTPASEVTDQFGVLAPALSIPDALSAQGANGDAARTNLLANKSKKELKQEEKDRKATQKAEEKERAAAQKAEEKAQAAKRREELDTAKKHEEDAKRLAEASKTIAAEDTKKRDEHTERTGLSRFTRPGSMSIKGRPRMFGNKDKEKDQVPPLVISSPQPLQNDTAAHLTALPTTPAMPHAVEELSKENGKEKKHRFSIGRKKSTTLK